MELTVTHRAASSQGLAVLKVPHGTSSTPLGQAQRNPYPWAPVRDRVLIARDRYPDIHPPVMSSRLFAVLSLTPRVTSSRSTASLSSR